MCRADITVLCCVCLMFGFLFGFSVKPSGTDKKLDTINANLVALNETAQRGITVRAYLDGIGRRGIGMYQNPANEWVIGAQDENDRAQMAPVMLFNFDTATIATAPMDPVPPLVPPTTKPTSPSGQ